MQDREVLQRSMHPPAADYSSSDSGTHRSHCIAGLPTGRNVSSAAVGAGVAVTLQPCTIVYIFCILCENSFTSSRIEAPLLAEHTKEPTDPGAGRNVSSATVGAGRCHHALQPCMHHILHILQLGRAGTL